MKNTILIWNRNYVFSEASLLCPSEKSVHISDDATLPDNEMLLSRATTKWNMWLDFFFQTSVSENKQLTYKSSTVTFL